MLNLIKSNKMTVFLSYASEDKKISTEIYLSLLSAGYKVFFDQTSLPSGANFHSQILNGIEACDAFIFLISQNSIKDGGYALTELNYAKDKWPQPWGFVLPVLIDNTIIKDIDPYLGAMTILNPSGNIAAEVTYELKKLLVNRKKKWTNTFLKPFKWSISIATVVLISYLILSHLPTNCPEQIKELKKIENYLTTTKAVYKDLSKRYFIFDTTANKMMDTYESYRYRRENGMSDTVLMKEQIASLMKYNEKIQNILHNYTNHLSKNFKLAADTFSRHAETTKIRFESIDRVIFTREQLDPAIAFPKSFPQALSEEIKLCN